MKLITILTLTTLMTLLTACTAEHWENFTRNMNNPANAAAITNMGTQMYMNANPPPPRIINCTTFMNTMTCR